MRISNNYITGIVFLQLSLNLFGQGLPLSGEMYPELNYYGLSGDVFYNDYLNVKGSAFLYNDWQKGDLILKNGDVLTNINLKFDLYANNLIVYHDLLHYQVLLDEGNVKGFTLRSASGEKYFIARENKGIKTKYETTDDIIMQVLAEGEVSLYKLEYRKMQKQSKSNEKTTAEFLNRKEYHFFIKGQDYNVKWKKKLLLGYYSDYKSDINFYVRHHHLRLRKENDLVELVQYLNSLVK
ncbi:MAG: hypothetical protein JXB49_34725 [Bacteroidales bacterium]|nr:hypothetical protein [Bacteroidales bacterium]